MNWISWHCNKLTAAEEKTCFLLLSNVVCASLCFAELLQKWQLLNVAGSESSSKTSTASVAVSYGGNSVCLFAIRKIQLKLYFDFHWKTSFSGWRKVGAVSNIVVSMRIWDSTFYFFRFFRICFAGCYVFHLYHIVCTSHNFSNCIVEFKIAILHMFVQHLLLHDWMAQFHFHLYFHFERMITTTESMLDKLLTVVWETATL